MGNAEHLKQRKFTAEMGEVDSPAHALTSVQKHSCAFKFKGYLVLLFQKQGFTLAIISGLSMCPLARAQMVVRGEEQPRTQFIV